MKFLFSIITIFPLLLGSSNAQLRKIFFKLKKIIAILFLGLLLIIPANAATGVVKKSKTNICHAPGTKYYKQTKYYKAFKTLQECLDSGGRLPKRK